MSNSENEPYPHNTHMERAEQQYLEEWLANRRNFSDLDYKYAKRFDNGARLVPVKGDGNCFFYACSIQLTACKDNKFGSTEMHDALRQKVCDHIVKQDQIVHSQIHKSLVKRGRVGEKFDSYIAGKRKTACYEGWSDGITFRGMIEMTDRPIIQ